MTLAKRLDQRRYEVKLVDRNNFHSFPPLFYQIASSGLAASNITFPFRREFSKHTNFTYHMGHVKQIDTVGKRIVTSYETIDYDKLVIAAGTCNNFFGMEGLDQNVFCIKTVGEAMHTRDEILDRLERGALQTDHEQRRKLLSFLVVGGGPAGVEIAGALGEMKKDVVPREYPELDPDDISITLVEGTGKLLAAMGEKSSEKALKYLKELMVEVRLNTRMSGYKDKTVSFSDGHSEYWETLIWTAGVHGEPMPGFPTEAIGHGSRIIVDRFNRVVGLEDSVMSIGDIALMTTDKYPHGHPQVAQPAIQQARCLAYNLNKGAFTRQFEYRDKGSMATVGKNKAVAQLPKMFFGGRLAWWVWMAIHLMSLVGMRNKLNVMLNWMWNYCTYSTSLRLLLRPTKYPIRKHWGD